MLRFDPPELRNDLARTIEAWKRQVALHREDDLSDDLVDITLPGFDPAEHEDKTITPETEFGLSLPKWDDAAIISYGGFVALAAELKQACLTNGCACWTDQRYLLRITPANDHTFIHLNRLLPDPDSEEERNIQLAYIERDRERRDLWEKIQRFMNHDIHGGEDEYDKELVAAWKETSGKALELVGKIDKPTRRYLAMPVSHDGIEATCSLTEGFTVFGPAVAASGDYDGDFPPHLPRRGVR